MAEGRPRPPKRRLDGVLLLDKPSGPSSNFALQEVRRLFRAAKAGHTGTLDPMASGMLPICFGEATKLAGLMLGGGKRYRATVRFGFETDSDDAVGAPTRQAAVPALDEALIRSSLDSFIGDIQQSPPAVSALKRDGVPDYRRVRQGESVERPPRTVAVHRIDLLASADDAIELDIRCGSGFYVRALARDLGRALGSAAHLSALQRVSVDPFADQPMIDFDRLAALDEGERDEKLLSLAQATAHLPRVHLDVAQSADLAFGRPVVVEAQAVEPARNPMAPHADAGPPVHVALNTALDPLGLVDLEPSGRGVRVKARRLFATNAAE